MILFFLFFFVIHLLCLFFCAFLFSVIFFNRDHSRIPTVYIYNMLLANVGELVTVLFIHLFPLLMDDQAYAEFRGSAGAVLTLTSTFSYEHPLYLTILMVFHRIFSVFFPFSKAFSDRKLWCYCAILAAISLTSLLIPFFSECQISVNQRESTYEAACKPSRHPITLWQNQYLYLIPVGCMVLNILLILYLSYQKYFLFKSMRDSITATSLSSMMRQSLERTLLFQSLATTTFLLLFELSGVLIRSFPDDYNQLSADVRRFVYYSRITTAGLLCFLVYFVGTPSIRELILGAARRVFRPSRPSFLSPVVVSSVFMT